MFDLIEAAALVTFCFRCRLQILLLTYLLKVGKPGNDCDCILLYKCCCVCVCVIIIVCNASSHCREE